MPHLFTIISGSDGSEIWLPGDQASEAWEKYDESNPISSFNVYHLEIVGAYRKYSSVPNYKKEISKQRNKFLEGDIDALILYYKSYVDTGFNKNEILLRIIKIGFLTNEVNELDKVIFFLHKTLWRESHEKHLAAYFKLLKLGVRESISTLNESLIETLIYALGKLVFKYKDFVDTANKVPSKKIQAAFFSINYPGY